MTCMWKKGRRRTIRVLKRAFELLMTGRDMREAGDALMEQGEKRNDVYRARTAVQKFLEELLEEDDDE